MERFWRFDPSFAEPYTWLLIAVVAVTIVRAGRLSWRLIGVPRRRITLDRLLDGTLSPEDLAYAALANRVAHEVLSEDRLKALRAGPPIDFTGVLRTLRAADAQFEASWRCLTVAVSATRNLIRLTLIAAAFVTAYAFLPKWEYLADANARYASVARLMGLFEAGHWTLVRLALGFGAAGVLCVVAMVFDGLLQHRLASWKYLHATVSDALSEGQPPE